MAIGISSACLYPLETEIAIEKLCDRSVGLIEIFFNSTSELKPDFLDHINTITKQSNTHIKSIHPFTPPMESYFLFSEYKRRLEDGIEHYKHFFQTAATLGAELVVLHGDRCTGQIEDAEYFERYHRLFEIGRSYDITLAQENVVGFRSQSPAFIASMAQQLQKDCAFVLDVKQARRAQVNVYEMADAMGDQLMHLHVSDYNEDETCLLPGNGVCDYSKLFSYTPALKRCDKVIEVYRDAYQEDQELFDCWVKLKTTY